MEEDVINIGKVIEVSFGGDSSNMFNVLSRGEGSRGESGRWGRWGVVNKSG